jgi:hypothetical protein
MYNRFETVQDLRFHFFKRNDSPTIRSLYFMAIPRQRTEESVPFIEDVVCTDSIFFDASRKLEAVT